MSEDNQTANDDCTIEQCEAIFLAKGELDKAVDPIRIAQSMCDNAKEQYAHKYALWVKTPIPPAKTDMITALRNLALAKSKLDKVQAAQAEAKTKLEAAIETAGLTSNLVFPSAPMPSRRNVDNLAGY